MFIPKYFFEKFVALLEAQHLLAQRQTEDSLQRVLDAKNSEVAAVVAVKDQQISVLYADLAAAKEQISHERQRAEAAVDILLTRDGNAGPIRNADLIREAAEREAAGVDATGAVPRPESRQDTLTKIFAQAASVLGDSDDESGTGLPRDEVATVGGVDFK